MSHHLQYQSAGAQNWWCEKCLKECSDVAPLDTAPEEHWSDFFIWFGGMLVKGYSAALAATFGLIMFVIGDGHWTNSSVNEDDIGVWEEQLRWCEVGRHRTLIAIDRYRKEQAQACFDDRWPSPEELQERIEIKFLELDAYEAKIDSLRDRLRTAHEDSRCAPVIVGQANQHQNH